PRCQASAKDCKANDGTTRRRGKHMSISTTPGTTPVEVTGKQQPGRQAFYWSRFGGLIPAILGIIWLVIAFYPILFMLMTSLRPLTDFFTDIPWLPPSHP